MKTPTLIPIIAAVVLMSLGGFVFVWHGKTEYKRGYLRCQNDGAALATIAAEDLKNELQKNRSCSDNNRVLMVNGWMRAKGD